MEKEKKQKEKFFTERDKILLKLFLFVFLICIVVLNWSDLSWFMNLQTAPRLISQRIQEFIPERRQDEETKTFEEKEEEEKVVYCERDEVVISSIGVTAPIVETTGTTEGEYRAALDRGVVRFPEGAYPGEKGLLVLLGHSAPPGWPDINYDRVFTEIDKLKEGDKVEVCHNNKLSVYTVVNEEIGKQVYGVGEDVPLLYPGENKKELVLMTCWPPGSSANRIGIRAVVK